MALPLLVAAGIAAEKTYQEIRKILPDLPTLGEYASFDPQLAADSRRYRSSLEATMPADEVTRRFQEPLARLVADPIFKRALDRRRIGELRAQGRKPWEALGVMRLSVHDVANRFGVREDVAAHATNLLLGEQVYVVDSFWFNPSTGVLRPPLRPLAVPRGAAPSTPKTSAEFYALWQRARQVTTNPKVIEGLRRRYLESRAREAEARAEQALAPGGAFESVSRELDLTEAEQRGGDRKELDRLREALLTSTERSAREAHDLLRQLEGRADSPPAAVALARDLYDRSRAAQAAALRRVGGRALLFA